MSLALVMNMLDCLLDCLCLETMVSLVIVVCTALLIQFLAWYVILDWFKLVKFVITLRSVLLQLQVLPFSTDS